MTQLKLPPEQQAIREKCFHPSGKFIEFPEEDVETSIPRRFEKIARAYPNNIAVHTEREAVTYSELNARANRVAHAILSKQISNPGPIALLVKSDATMIAATLGILKTGKIYVPLSLSFPREKLASIIQDVQPGLVLAETASLSITAEDGTGQFPLLNVDKLEESLPIENLNLEQSPDTLAAIFYTSGSAGRPKGVMQSHRGVLHRILIDTNSFHICSHDRLSLLSAPTYSVSLRNLFGALLNGATVNLFDVEKRGLGGVLQWLRQQQISVYFSVPTVFRHITENLPEGEVLSTVRLIYLGGEAVTKRDFELYRKHFARECIFANSLASNEAGIFRTFFLDKNTEVADNILPAGYEVEDKDLLLLNEAGQEITCGDIGEIAIRSRYLSPGYWLERDLTATVFLPDPNEGDRRIYRTGDVGLLRPDGCLVYLGRKDLRVKIRGIRIELEEIEAVLRLHPAVEEAAVVAKLEESEGGRLIAYIVPIASQSLTTSEVRRFLQAKLPDYMLPSSFVFMPSLPVTTNGKINRHALPLPERIRPDLDTPFLRPKSLIETRLVKIWSSLLGIDQVGVHDNLFDLGGDSLIASRILARVCAEFQLTLSLENLFRSPTVAEMALLVSAQRREIGDLATILCDVESLTEEEAHNILARQLGDKRAV
jgi:amino acid adenylation domain-containing protein